jgi:signal transduction histidine kinase
MQSAAQRMSAMIQGLLGYSSISTKARAFEPVNLRKAAQDSLLDLEVRLERTGGRVELGDLPVVEADPLQMRQLFQNLIGNALKFHRAGVPPIVTVKPETVAEPGPFTRKLARFVVEDNGVGFDERNLHRLFQPFERLHGRSEFEGAGIGLAICRKIVERHGGSITATSRPGEGSRFIVTLPYRQYGEGT